MAFLFPVLGCSAKIHRADHSIHQLAAETAAFAEANLRGYRIVSEGDADTKTIVVKLYGDDTPIPPCFAVVAGEIIHHLRSALDHLVYALGARQEPNMPDRWRQELSFPIKGHPKAFK